MRKSATILASVALMAAAFLTSSCVRTTAAIKPSKKTVTISKSVSPFTDIDVSSAINVIYTQGSGHSVSIRLPENLADKIRFRQDGKEISISYQNLGSTSGDINTTVFITTPRLKSIELSGACTFSSSEINMPANDMDIDISGASNVTIENLKVNALEVESSGASNVNIANYSGIGTDIDVSGASRVKISGVTSKLTLDVSGASNASLSGLRAKTGSVEVSGASKASTNILNLKLCKQSGVSSFENDPD